MNAVAVVGCCGSTGRCERFWSLWAPSAAKLERTAAVVVTVITVLTVITAAVKKSAVPASAALAVAVNGGSCYTAMRRCNADFKTGL